MYLTFIINEGPQYKVRSISFIGEKTFDTARLNKDLKLHANEFFNQGAMNHDLATVRDLYGTYGFVFADIQADPRLLEESAQLDLVYNIKEGARYRVGKINISIAGESPHTNYATVLDRIELRPGDILDTNKLRRASAGWRGAGCTKPKIPTRSRRSCSVRHPEWKTPTSNWPSGRMAEPAGRADRARRMVPVPAAHRHRSDQAPAPGIPLPVRLALARRIFRGQRPTAMPSRFRR